MKTPVAETEYWFARRFPLSDARQSMAPVHWKGWLVSVSFVAAMLIGASAFAWFALQDEMMKGAAFFCIAAFIGGLWFISVTRMRGDRIRCVRDYQGGKPIA